MHKLIRADLRHARGSFIGVFVAVLFASALITGLGVLLESGIRGGPPPQRYIGAPVVVAGPQAIEVPEDMDVPLAERSPLPKGASATIAALPGVDRVIPDRSVPMVADGTPVSVHGWSSAEITPVSIVDGRAPASNREAVVTDRSASRIGDRVVLDRAGARTEVRVVGVVADPTDPGTERPLDVFLTNSALSRIAPGAARVLAVFPADGTSAADVAGAIVSAVPGVVATTGDARGDLEFRDAGAARSNLIALSLAFAGTCLLVALFIVSGTLSLSVQTRHRDFALLRAVGATGSQIRGIVTREVLIVAGLAAAVGVVPGYLLANELQRWFVDGGLLPSDFALVRGPLPAVAAAAAVLVSAIVAGLIAARRPAKLDPVEALREAAAPVTPPHGARLVSGIALTVGGLGVSTIPMFVSGDAATTSAAGSAMLLIIGIALLGPWLVGGFAAVVGTVLTATRQPSAVLAAESSRFDSRRLAAAVTPLAMGIALGLVQLGAPSIAADAAATQIREGIVAELSVSHPGGLSDDKVDELAQLPNVRAVQPMSPTQAVVDFREFGAEQNTRKAMSLTGIDPAAADSTLDMQVSDGDLARLTGPSTVALSTDFASTTGLGIGDRLVGFFGDGTQIDAEVVATYKRGLGFGDAFMDGAAVRAHTEAGVASEVLLNVEPGTEPQVQAAVEELSLTAVPASSDPIGQEAAEQQSWVSRIALVVILGYIAIAVVNTLVMATASRRRDFALLSLVGGSRRQIRGMMRTESVLVAGAAVLFGLFAAAPPLVAMSYAMGGRVVPAMPLIPSVVVVVAMCGVGMAALAVGTRVTMRGADVAQ